MEQTIKQKVGFIGLGRMGAGMAGRLLGAGYQCTVYNRTPGKARELVERGAQQAFQIEDACTGDIVITMLSDDLAVKETVFTSNGIIKNMQPGAIHISMSTISPELSERLTIEHETANQHYIAAPVFGRPEAAADGRLSIVAAGEESIINKCIPLFETMGQKIIRLGDKQKLANVAKISGNFLIASVIEALGESIALTGKAGINNHEFVEMLTSTLFSCPVYSTYGSLIATNKKVENPGFTVKLGEKDIRLALSEARKLLVPMPFANIIHDHFVRLLANRKDNYDWSELGKLSLFDSGISETN